jgi:hypothetical protein
MTEFTVHATHSDQANDPCFYVPSGIPSGTTRVDATMSYDKARTASSISASSMSGQPIIPW